MKETIKVIDQDAGLPVGTELTYNEDTGMYTFETSDTEVGDGYEYTKSTKTTYSKHFVDDYLGVYFEEMKEEDHLISEIETQLKIENIAKLIKELSGKELEQLAYKLNDNE